MSMPLFTYGTLMCPDIFAAVAGRRVASSAALLIGYQRFALLEKTYPAIVADAPGRVEGCLYEDLSDVELARLDCYEGDWYQRITVEVTMGEAKIAAYAYILRDEFTPQLEKQDWDFGKFLTENKDAYLYSL